MNDKDIVVTHRQRSDRLGSFTFISLFYYAYCLKTNLEFRLNPDPSNRWFDTNDVYAFLGWDRLMGMVPGDCSFRLANSLDELACFGDERIVNLLSSEVEEIEKRMIDGDFSSFFPCKMTRDLHDAFLAANQGKRAAYFDPQRPNIAVHIRRGDVTSNFFEHAYFPNRVFLNLIDGLQRSHPEAAIHVFACESNEEGWDDFEALGCTLHLRADYSRDQLLHEKLDLLHFVLADILVIGGTFSYMPAFLNRNTVLYPEMFWHSPLDRWAKYDRDGRLGELSAATSASVESS